MRVDSSGRVMYPWEVGGTVIAAVDLGVEAPPPTADVREDELLVQQPEADRAAAERAAAEEVEDEDLLEDLGDEGDDEDDDSGMGR